MKKVTLNKLFLSIVVSLVLGGFLIFISASLGLLAGSSGANFYNVVIKQFLVGIIGGGLAFLFFSNLHYRHLRRYAIYIFTATLLLTAAVIIPGVGTAHGGAVRWLDIGGFSLQPSELLKIGFVIYIATWLSGAYTDVKSWKHGLLPFVIVVGLTGGVMMAQPDTDTFLLMAASGMAMLLTSGARWRDMALIIVAGLLVLSAFALKYPYMLNRLHTFQNPTADLHGGGWQVEQARLAIGSGGVSGKGFGQSIQKFKYLPEPIGDSIFAVFGEEFGYVGTSLLIFLFTAFTFIGYKIATRTKDKFGMFLVVGFTTLIFLQAFLNIGSMTRTIPLFGLTLPFVSHGGTSLLVTLIMAGIIYNVAKNSPQSKRS